MKDGRSRVTLGSRMKHGMHVDQVKDAISRLREKVPSPDSTPVLYDNNSNIIDGFTITTPTDDFGSDKSGSAPPTVTNAQPKIQCGCTCKCVVTNAATSAQTEGLVPSTGANTQAPIASKTNNTVGGSANAPAVKGTFVKLVTAAEDSAIELAAAVVEGTIKHADNVVDTDVDTSNGETADETGADSEGILVGLTAGAAGKPQLPPQADGGDEWPDGAGTPQTPMAANGDSKHGDMAPRTDEIGSSVDPSLAGHDNVCPVAQVASGLSAQQTQAASCGQHRVFQILATKLCTFYAATNEPRIDFNKYTQGSSRLENLSFKRSLVLCDRPIEELCAIKCGGPVTQARYSEPATPAEPCASEPGTDKQRRCRSLKRLTDSSTLHVAGLLAAVNASLFGHLDEAEDMQRVELDSTSMQQPMVE
ncbi:hypothetical protein H4S07_004173 [Coemansia furcata]|uniref:Uncharacterized protein n=1 Tax=Coemansia furcata TaxID=417177 RepID=A0ACC1LB80_9FUNG|nr:hypothetical protein H4S07_004173 [Coemansia furcata]